MVTRRFVLGVCFCATVLNGCASNQQQAMEADIERLHTQITAKADEKQRLEDEIRLLRHVRDEHQQLQVQWQALASTRKQLLGRVRKLER